MTKIKEGSSAPDFSLPDKDNQKISLKDIKEKYIVLYFYPKDDTPGCTIEAKEFTDLAKKYAKADIKVIGVSGGDAKTKTKFCEKHDLNLLLLSDTDLSVSKKYDSYGEKSFMGRKFNGIFRNTFVLDKDRNIIKIYESVSAKGHAQEVLDFIQGC